MEIPYVSDCKLHRTDTRRITGDCRRDLLVSSAVSQIIEWIGVGQNEFLPPLRITAEHLVRWRSTGREAPILGRVLRLAER